MLVVLMDTEFFDAEGLPDIYICVCVCVCV